MEFGDDNIRIWRMPPTQKKLPKNTRRAIYNTNLAIEKERKEKRRLKRHKLLKQQEEGPTIDSSVTLPILAPVKGVEVFDSHHNSDFTPSRATSKRERANSFLPNIDQRPITSSNNAISDHNLTRDDSPEIRLRFPDLPPSIRLDRIKKQATRKIYPDEDPYEQMKVGVMKAYRRRKLRTEEEEFSRERLELMRKNREMLLKEERREYNNVEDKRFSNLLTLLHNR